MIKKHKKIVIFLIPFLLISTVLYAGFYFGLPSAVEEKVEELDAKVLEEEGKKIDETARIAAIDANNEVYDVHVATGTEKAAAMAFLTDTIVIRDTLDNNHTVQVNWTLETYVNTSSGVYITTGTFEMPEGVEQTEPETLLEVYAGVEVLPPLAVDEVYLVNDYLLVIGQADGSYLMWPREKSCAATNYDNTLQWRIYNMGGQPTWDPGINRYTFEGISYPYEEDEEEFRAFIWINELNAAGGYRGYPDWRLPRQKGPTGHDPHADWEYNELRQLYDTANADISSSYTYWGGTEDSPTGSGSGSAFDVWFHDNGYIYSEIKEEAKYVRAARKIE